MRVAFCGLGRMGAAMAAHVPAAGFQLTVWNRTPGRAADLVAAGAREAPSLAEAAREADVVVLMLFGPESVREVLGQLEARPGALVVDATTVGPSAARELAALATARALRWVDAPVVGTVGPAREGTLGVLVGGADGDVAEVRPLLEAWGDPARIRHVGPVGAGNALKVVVNLCLGVAIEGVGEALRLAGDLGLDRSVTLDALAAGPLGFTVAHKRAMLDTRDFSAATFSLELLDKDLRLALAEARRPLPAVAATEESAAAGVRNGRGREDYAALTASLES